MSGRVVWEYGASSAIAINPLWVAQAQIIVPAWIVYQLFKVHREFRIYNIKS